MWEPAVISEHFRRDLKIHLFTGDYGPLVRLRAVIALSIRIEIYLLTYLHSCTV